MQVKYIVYGKPSCPYCSMATDLLLDQQIEFEYFGIENEFYKDELLDKMPPSAPRTVPQIFVLKDGVESYVGGYDALKLVLDAGEDL